MHFTMNVYLVCYSLLLGLFLLEKKTKMNIDKSIYNLYASLVFLPYRSEITKKNVIYICFMFST